MCMEVKSFIQQMKVHTIVSKKVIAIAAVITNIHLIMAK